MEVQIQPTYYYISVVYFVDYNTLLIAWVSALHEWLHPDPPKKEMEF